jgi:protein phosphatase
MTTRSHSTDALPVEVACERGTVRSRNEDAFLAEPALGLFVVADGVGGAPAGDVASQLAVDEVHACLNGGCDGFGDIAQALLRAHHALRRRGAGDPTVAGMATTAVAAWVDPDGGTLTVGHVGDSRAYLRVGGRLRRLTDDHGRGAVLTQALGQQSPPQPEIVEVALDGAEVLVLCTDGVTDVIDDTSLAGLLTGDDLGAMRDRVVATAYDNGTRDNLTVLAVDLTRVARG